jgi:uncharacterized RDD family membrane protein YckC
MTAIIALVIQPSPAGFWRRVVAALVDFAVFAIVRLGLGVLARRVGRMDDSVLGLHGTVVACTVLFAALYVITLHALEGQTIGKLVVGARVVDQNGAPPALGTSILRVLAYGCSLVPFGLGFFMIGLRRDRRGLHDLLAGTRVERVTKPAPSIFEKENSWTSS